MENTYELRQFHATEGDIEEPSSRLRAWRSAVARGFNEPKPTRQQTQRTAQTAFETGAVLTEVLHNGASPDNDIAKLPAGTFIRFPGQVNLGARRFVAAAFISEVTVQSRHKRRGILTKMMTTNLKQAQGEGGTAALLTASSGSLYGRYGFHNITDFIEAKLKPKPSFKFTESAEQKADWGTVEPVTLQWLADRADSIYKGYLNRHRGATTRYPTYFEDGFYAPHLDAPSPKYFAAVHIAPDGSYDGYAIYSVFRETVMQVAEVVAGNSSAELALWNFLTDVELTETIYYPHFRSPLTLPLALTDSRAIQVTGMKDGLWARILDTKTALESRPYALTTSNGEAKLTIEVEDPLKIADGIYQLTVSDGGTKVIEDEDAHPDLTVDARGLAALTFGATLPSDLWGAGLLATQRPDMLRLADLIFAPVGPAGFLAEF